jgi:hypothetical protein
MEWGGVFGIMNVDKYHESLPFLHNFFKQMKTMFYFISLCNLFLACGNLLVFVACIQ